MKSCLRVQKNQTYKGTFRARFSNLLKFIWSSEKGLYEEVHTKAKRGKYNMFGNCREFSMPEEKRLKIKRRN